MLLVCVQIQPTLCQEKKENTRFAKNNQKKTQMRNQKQQQKAQGIELRATG